MKAWSHLKNWERVSILILIATFGQACNQVTAPSSADALKTESSSSFSSEDNVRVPHYNLESGHEFETRLSQGDHRVCLSSTASVIGRSHTQIELSGNATIQGSVALLNGSSLRCTGNAKVNGTVHTSSDHSVFTSGRGFIRDEKHNDLTPYEPALMTYVSELGNLTPTVNFNEITHSLQITGNGGLNVIRVSGKLNLSGQSQLVLRGSSQDVFIIQVQDEIHFSGQAGIQTAGTLKTKNIVFVSLSNQEAVSLSGNGNLTGTLLAPFGSIRITGNSKVKGAIVGSDSIQISGNGFEISAEAFCPDTHKESDDRDDDDDRDNDDDRDDDNHDCHHSSSSSSANSNSSTSSSDASSSVSSDTSTSSVSSDSSTSSVSSDSSSSSSAGAGNVIGI